MPVQEKNRAVTARYEAALSALQSERPGAVFSADAVQANVVRSVNPQQARYVFFQIVDGDAFRRFVGGLLHPQEAGDPESGFHNQPADIRTLFSEAAANEYDASGKRTVKPYTWNVAFTWTGLQALEIDKVTLDSFPEDFRDGMAARATRLGDVGELAPSSGKAGLAAGTCTAWSRSTSSRRRCNLLPAKAKRRSPNSC